ncbi:MAG: hypothetical protein BWX70_03054 [Verrucomicrobia bacterium ADurb.Bin070]|nr:MAG: hypothetical protein BWX70_03054 [Verrucomicrobia bacterium ADurb.Bin070]
MTVEMSSPIGSGRVVSGSTFAQCEMLETAQLWYIQSRTSQASGYATVPSWFGIGRSVGRSAPKKETSAICTVGDFPENRG